MYDRKLSRHHTCMYIQLLNLFIKGTFVKDTFGTVAIVLYIEVVLNSEIIPPSPQPVVVVVATNHNLYVGKIIKFKLLLVQPSKTTQVSQVALVKN